MYVFARFDEIPKMTLKDISKTKRHGRTDGKMGGQHENSIPAHKHSLRGGGVIIYIKWLCTHDKKVIPCIHGICTMP